LKKISPETVIKTERLELAVPSDALSKTMFEYLTPAITRHMTFYPPKTVAEQRASIRKFIRENLRLEAWHAAVFAKESGEFLGMCGVAEYFEDTGTAEIWYWLAEKYQGKGYATEAVRGLCEHLFSAGDFNRVLIRVDANNSASRAVAERVGAKLDGVIRSHVAHKGDLRDTAFYTLFAGELV
jgi:RimJ/RimL family protein N-acetyltransferase